MKKQKTAEEIIQIIQKEEQQIWKTIKKIKNEERESGKCYTASIERLTAEHNAIRNLMDELEVEPLPIC